MAAGEDITAGRLDVLIGAKISELQSGMAEATGVVEASSAKINESLASMSAGSAASAAGLGAVGESADAAASRIHNMVRASLARVSADGVVNESVRSLTERTRGFVAATDAERAALQTRIAAQETAMGIRGQSIVQLGAQAEAHTAAAAAAGEQAVAENAVTSALTKGTVVREYTALLDEALSGRTRMMTGTLAVLGNRLGIMQSLFSPLGIAIAGVTAIAGTFIAALIKGQAEASAFNSALAASGGYLGVTEGQFFAMADSAAQGGVRVGQLRESLQAAAATGRFSGDELMAVGRGAAAMAQLLGISAEQAVGEFTKLGKDPVQAVTQLNEKLHFLTPEIYDEIAALQRQNDVQGATTLAVHTLSDAMAQRAEKAEESKGIILRAIDEEKRAWGQLWDVVMGVGRGETPESKLSKIRDQIDETVIALDHARKSGGFSFGEGDEVTLRARLDTLLAEAQAQQKVVDKAEAQAKAEAEAAKAADAYVIAKEDVDRLTASLDKAERKQQEINKLNQDFQAMAAVGKLPTGVEQLASGGFAGGEYDRLLKAIEEKYRVHTGELIAMDREALQKLEADQQVSDGNRLQFEARFWRGKLTEAKAGSAQYAAIYHQLMTVQGELDREAAAAAKRAAEEKKRIADEELAAALAHSRALLQIKSAELDQEVALGKISDGERIQDLRQMEQREFAIELQHLQQRKAALAQQPVEQAKVNREIESLQDKHVLRMQQLANQMDQYYVSKYKAMLQPVSSAFETSIQGMIMGTQTLRQAVGGIFQAILGEFVNLGVSMLIDWTAKHLAMRAVGTATAAEQTATLATQLATGHAMQASAAVANVLSNAAAAAAGAAASVASIPFVGWLMAPAVAAETYAATASYAPLASAAGGWEVPADQLAMVHKNEMVLPATISQGLKGMIAGNAPMSKQEIHIHAVDVKGIRDLLSREGPALVRSVNRQIRNFNYRGA